MSPEEILQQRAAVIRVAHEWLKTPYVHAAHVKGHGTSCSGLVADSFNEAIGTHLSVSAHDERWYMTATEQLYLKNLVEQGFVEVTRETALPADLVISNTRYKIYCHSGIITNWPKPASAIHVSVNGAELAKSIWSNWYFALKPDTHKYFRWGGWV
jgi:cell wall-associated NlpC family hydrolase